eukprot:gb/GECH01012782.1/.p1 GENE.gb/GECH01012782.1/~~gb/GECH01012782.1/.p1  ORF type:complete len:284 (+),score=38.07 gb/GECH01012782.1/:1-852(+)
MTEFNPFQSAWSFLYERYSLYTNSTFVPWLFLLTSHIVFNLPLLLIELIDFKCLQKYKIQKHQKLTKEKLKHVLFGEKHFTHGLIFSYFCIMLPLQLTSFPALVGMGFDIGPTVPPLGNILGQMCFFIFMEDFAHFVLHRALHTDALWWVHTVHHEFRAPIGLAASYAHPIEVLVLGMCTFAGPLVIRPHIFVFTVWANMRQAFAIETHCGYDFPWSPNNLIPLCGGAEFHDYHHRVIKGAYSSNFMFWDWLFGTDRGYWQNVAKRRRANHNLNHNNKTIKTQ